MAAISRVYKEEELIEQLKAKNKDALSYLYDHYSAALYGVVLRILKNEDLAEEVLQDVFLKIWNRIDSYNPEKGRLFTWMLNLTRNQAIDKTRSKEISQGKKTDDIDNLVGSVDRENSSELFVDSIGLKDVLNKLPEEQKFVVEFLYLKGYTQSELAEEYNIPLGTVKTRLRMAMIALRSIMNIN
jgi:RNA polymerase sigma-70 factor (ECF subfamily)